MAEPLRQVVRERAGGFCEYCRLHEDQERYYSFQVEHIVARQHSGTDALSNLAWSCHECNLAKSSNLSGVDPMTGRVIMLFNPRRQRWKRHFRWKGARLIGRTACGRATIDVLNINEPERIDLRELLVFAGLFPGDE